MSDTGLVIEILRQIQEALQRRQHEQEQCGF